jgi:pimeloyl-ACP methyl ester carboxylesterase
MSGRRTVAGARGVRLAVYELGEGRPVVLLHGLTATHRYVVMGSRLLQRTGHSVMAYDARGHGRSDPAPTPTEYDYSDLAADLEAVLDVVGMERPVLAGQSMGSHTAVRFALDHPERVGGLVLITPAYDPATFDSEERVARWLRLAEGLDRAGVDGFIDAYGPPPVQDRWREPYLTVMEQRLSSHRHLDALADALRIVPVSRPFQSFDELAAITAPATVIASRDEADPGHPLEVGEKYAAAIPGSRLVVDQPGKSPIAWQGAQVSKLIAEVAERAA